MSKQTETPEKMPQPAKMTSLKINPRIRYLADLASTVTGQSLTGYIETALVESFAKVTLRLPPEPEVSYEQNGEAVLSDPPDPEIERVQNEAKSIANLADLLWSESEFVRIEMLSSIARHLVPTDDLALLHYIRNRKDLQIPTGGNVYKLNRDKIELEWASIQAAHQQKTKGKVK